MVKLFGAVVLVCLLQGIYAQVQLNGQCPTSIKAITSSTLGVFPSNGIVYHYAAIPDTLTEDLKCVWSKFTQSSPNDVITYGGVEIANNKVVTRPYRAFELGTNTYAIDTGKETIEYFAIDSDNQSYVTNYSCKNISATQYSQYIWVMTRDRQPSAETVQKVRAGITANKLNNNLVKVRDQKNCPAAV